MKFKSLRWRMTAAFGLVILLTLLLSGLLSLWATANRFDILVTDEGRQRAEAMAPLLEASYALNGDWHSLETLISGTLLPEDAWFSDVDWLAVTMDTLGLDDEALFAEWDRLGSLTAVAAARNISPDQLVNDILAAEEESLDTAVTDGNITSEEADIILAQLPEQIRAFIFEDGLIEGEMFTAVDWDAVIAGELGLSLDQFYNLWDSQTIAEIADERGVLPEQLVAAILAAEKANITDREFSQPEESTFYLADTLSLAREYIYEDGFLVDFFVSPDVFGLATSSLFGEERVLVADAHGIVIYDSVGEKAGESLAAEQLEQGVTLWNLAQAEPIGTVLVAAGPGFYNAQQTAFLQGVALAMLISGLAAGAVALLAGWLVARRITAPVTALTQATRRIADGRERERLPVTSADELGQMSQAFNQMAAALEMQHNLRKRLVDDVSHELHTPLSIIQLELEAMRDGMQSPEEAATHTLAEIGLLRNLVDDLSLLVDGADGRISLALEPVNLAELTQQTVNRWQPQAEAAGIRLTLESPPPLPPVPADPVRLTQALSNLLRNAIQHTAAGGHIAVSLYSERDETGEWVVTAVRDDGAGIPPEDLPHIFNRFYRADESRTRNGGGRGLGLSIARQIVKLHDGRIWAESEGQGKGTVFIVQLPLVA